MAIELGRAVFSLLTDHTKFDADMDRSGQKAEGFRSKLGTLKTVVGAAAGAIVTEGAGALQEFARMAQEDEVGVARLQTAVEATGTSYETVGPSIEALIAKNQELAISDDQTRAALSTLTQTTGDVNKAMDLMSLTTDLARGKHLDLETAATIVGKVAEGNTGILTRYGITIDKNATSSEALALLQNRFAGQAEAYGNTSAAAVEKVRDKVSEWAEGIGYAIGPAGTFLTMLPGITSAVTLLGSGVGAVIPHLGGLKVALLADVIPSIGATIVALGPILIPLAAIAAAVALLALAWSNNWFDIQGKAQAVMDFITGAIRAFQEEGLGGLLRYLGNFVGNVMGAMQGVGRGIVEGLMQGLAGLAGAVWDALVSAFRAIDFWVGPFHVSSSGVSVSMPSISFPSLPGFAAGGTVPGPYGSPQLVVAHGGEHFLGMDGRNLPSSEEGAGHGHDVLMDGEVVSRLIGRRYVRGAAREGGAIG